MPIFRYNETAGDYYAYLIEGHGNDLNDGLTPETAVASLDRLVEILDTYAGASRRHAVIVKKRIYNEGISYARTEGRPITFEFVGGCEIDGSGVIVMKFIGGDYILKGIIVNYQNTNLIGNNIHYFNSIIMYSNIASGSIINPQFFFYDSVAINSILWSGATGSASYRGNIIIKNSCVINCSANKAARINGSFVALNSIFEDFAVYGAEPSETELGNYTIDFCVINGLFQNKTLAYLQSLGKNLNGFSANPQFTDPTNGQYTVNQSSPCLYRAEGGEHIGIGEGFYLQANILYFQQSAINNFQLTTGRLGFIDPLDNAFIETNPIDIGQIITLESAELAAILPTVAGEFTAGPVHYSHWYPAYSAASTYHKGAGVTDSAILYRSLVDDNINNTPASSATEWERLTWESGVSYAAGKIVQYTDDKWYKANTATSTSWVAGEWDEVVMTREWNLQVKTGRTYDECDAADWATIPYNTTPYLDTAGLGNSDDAYDPTTGAVMVFRFIAVRIDAKTIV